MITAIKFYDRIVAIRGIGQLFYQDGFPISMAIDELSHKGIEVSLYHVANECMDNGWSADTTIRKLKGETDIDINHSMAGVRWDSLVEFCQCLEQPLRANGGYERSREIIFEYLFMRTHNDMRMQPLTALLSIDIFSV